MTDWLRSVLLPVEGTHYAGSVDNLYSFLLYMGAFFFLLIAGLLTYFLIRYRRRGPDDKTPHIVKNHKLEVVWTLIPLALVMFIFFWGFHTYMDAAVSPGDAMEIQVTAKKWVWQFEYPNGIRTLNELHVPINKPIRLVMTSEDVIHSFFVPTFRIKQDVLPNTYTQLWFTATEPGMHRLFCAEYCGRSHSEMLGRIFVDDEKTYNEWLETGGDEGKNMPLAEFGAMLFKSRGCNTCHSLDGTRGEGPSFRGVFGSQVKLQDGSVALADENYIRESILRPQAKVVAGFQPIMPTFEGMLREREINALVEFIKAQR
ncbi:MAG: cytochrome c oxidase subunit II [Rhodospirillales bacterium]